MQVQGIGTLSRRSDPCLSGSVVAMQLMPWKNPFLCATLATGCTYKSDSKGIALSQTICISKASLLPVAEAGASAGATSRRQREHVHVQAVLLTIPIAFFSTSTDAVWAWCPGHH